MLTQSWTTGPSIGYGQAIGLLHTVYYDIVNILLVSILITNENSLEQESLD